MPTYSRLRRHEQSLAAPGLLGLPQRLAAFAALAAAAAFAVFAQLGGAPPRTPVPAFLHGALGSSDSRASLARRPAPGVRVSILDSGFRVADADGAVAVVPAAAGSDLTTAWQRYEGGASRATGFGTDAVVFDPKGQGAEQFLVVAQHHGVRVWRWRLATSYVPRVNDRGVVGFFRGARMMSQWIPPAQILDANGKDVTPKGLHWSAVRTGGAWWLELRLDDAKLPLPYAIDPAVLRTGGAGTVATGGTSFNVLAPSAEQPQDLLVLFVAVAVASAPATPSGWTLVPNSSANQGQGSAVFYRKATGSDTATVTVCGSAVAEIFDYRG